MSDRISSVLCVPHEALDAAGVFDRFVDIDSCLHIDPHLLSASRAPELAAASKTLNQYWTDSIVVVRNIFERGDRFWREAVRRLTFPENANIGLGYAKNGTLGAAIGQKIATGLADTAQQVVRAGIDDPKVFELVGLLEPNIGPDLISDMTAHIIEPHLLSFTQRVCSELEIQTQATRIRGTEYFLPRARGSGNHLILLPRDILRDLPVAFCWEEVDMVCAYNESLRSRVNALIGENWRRAIDDNRKEKLKRVLVENPEALSDMIRQYREKPITPYDFAQDILGETIWLDAARKAAGDFPLDLKRFGTVTQENLMEVVLVICDHFRHLVENCGLFRVFWTDEKQLRHERLPQLLFFAVADSYCRANKIDLSPEVNSGRGPVDFKLSKGYDLRVLVELKWSSNRKLAHGFKTQLREYEKAEQTQASILLVIQVGSGSSIETVQSLRADAIRKGERVPELKIVDGRFKNSASHF